MFNHTPGYFSEENADELYARCLQEIPWQTMEWSRGKNLPRLVYRYDQGRGISVLDELFQDAKQQGFQPTGIWCNYYRDGKDYTPYHRDDYGGRGVLTYSFGTKRKFYMKRNTNKEVLKMSLGHGDVFYFDRETDSLYKHSIPKESGVEGGRVSIVLFV